MIRIRYHLSLPPNTPPDEVERLLKELQQFCLDQPFENVIAGEKGFSARLGLKDSKPFDVFLDPQNSTEGICWPGYKLADPEFLHRYMSVIRALDKAKALGFEVEVKDGGGYWKGRDVAKLLAVKKVMDNLPDAQLLFGAMSDNTRVGYFKKNLKQII